jgi:hypothetical protein
MKSNRLEIFLKAEALNSNIGLTQAKKLRIETSLQSNALEAIPSER